MKKLILFLFIVIQSSYVFSLQPIAGDITYRQIGGYGYMITVRIFDDPTTSVGDCEIIVGSGTGDSSYAQRTNGPSFACPASHDGVIISTCQGSIRYSVYETTHTFSGAGTYFINALYKNRDVGICNLIDSENSPFFLSTQLIVSPFFPGSNNNGPDYTGIPIVCGTVGFPLAYDPGVMEADYDSLYFEQCPVLNTTSYATPPASSFFWNDQNGVVIWDSPTMICTYVFGLRIEEWRDMSGTMQKVGETRQEVYASISPSTGINESQKDIIVSVFPNPSESDVSFSISGLSNPEYSLHVFNPLGQNILNIHPESNVKLTSLTPGIYFYTLSGPEDTIRQGKFMVSGKSVK